MKPSRMLILLSLIGFALTGCATTELGMPTVVINTPVNSSLFPEGQDVPVQSNSEDGVGVARVELLVDGQLVTMDTSPNGQPQKSFATIQTWRATKVGAHAVVVRATNTRGQIGEAAILITVSNASPTLTLSDAFFATPVPTTALTRVAITASATKIAPSATKTTPRPAATVIPTSSKRTLVLTEAQVNALINTALAASEFDYISVASVSLQNGQISAKGTYKGPGGISANGVIVVAVSASSCDLKITVLQAQVGQFAIPESRKAQINQAINKAITSALAQQYDYRCIESVTIANGVMKVVYY